MGATNSTGVEAKMAEQINHAQVLENLRNGGAVTTMEPEMVQPVIPEQRMVQPEPIPEQHEPSRATHSSSSKASSSRSSRQERARDTNDNPKGKEKKGLLRKMRKRLSVS